MPAAPPSTGISPAQVKRIHALKTALGMDDATYRAALALCGVTTSKTLTYSGAAELIADFEDKAVAAGTWRKYEAPATPSALRLGFATPAQLGMIKALWAEVSTVPEAGRKAALRKFVARQAKVSDLRFLRDSDASRVICALQAMQRQQSAARSA